VENAGGHRVAFRKAGEDRTQSLQDLVVPGHGPGDGQDQLAGETGGEGVPAGVPPKVERHSFGTEQELHRGVPQQLDELIRHTPLFQPLDRLPGRGLISRGEQLQAHAPGQFQPAGIGAKRADVPAQGAPRIGDGGLVGENVQGDPPQRRHAPQERPVFR
jgi:hypothetical protein